MLVHSQLVCLPPFRIFNHVMFICLFGPGRTGQIFVYFAKKFVTSCLRQVRLVIFRSTKFCKSLPNFKDAVVLPQSRTNFCQAWNLHDLNETVNQENVISIFSRSISVRSPLNLLFLVPERCSRKRWSLHWHSRSSNCFCWSWTNSGKKKTITQAIIM